MPEERIFFNANGVQIEGLLEDLSGDKSVVITHPHPLYGGDMNNNVVDAVRRVFKEKGYSTLRFNFRGVGQSGGSHDNGISEQDDVKGALQYLSDLGKTRITLAGYSFGAWVSALALETLDQVERLVMVSPPIHFMDFAFLKYNPKIQLVIAGTEDEFGQVSMIKEMIPTWNPEATLKVIQGADHFYIGKTQEIQKILNEFFNT
jgi:alpha/beta superfamily hydrolase